MLTTLFSNHTWQWYLILAGMSCAVLFGVVWARRVWLDARGEVDDENSTTEDILTPLALAYKSGQMSEQEYRRIRDSLARGEAGGHVLARTPPGKPGPRIPAPGPREPTPPDPPV